MELLIRAKGIIVEYAQRRVLDGIDVNVYEGDRIGLIGENGAGKNTLLRVLTRDLMPDEGKTDVFCTTAAVWQFGEGEDMVYSDVNSSAEMAARFDVQQAHGGLSGGECTRRRIAAALSKRPELLLLDEPTTDLDARGVSELTSQLNAYDGSIILISHDRTLLNAICTSIIELEDGRITQFAGNYDGWMREKARRRDFQQFEYDEYRREKARLQDSIERRERRAKKSRLPSRMGNSEARLHRREATEVEEKLHKSAAAMKSRLDQLEKKERPRDMPQISMRLGEGGGIISKKALAVKHLKVAVPGRVLIRNADFFLPTGSRTLLTGDNGCGKTTLIKALVEGDYGVTAALGLKIGYFSQNGAGVLDMDGTVLDNAMSQSAMPVSVARTVLNNLMIGEDMVFKPVRVLSGGERVKVEIARLLLSDCNMLILDEPTNHLDVYSLEALERLLKEYAGTLLLVSHDRRFASEIAQRMLILEGGALTVFEGSVDEYERRRQTPVRQEAVRAEEARLNAEALRMRMAAIDGQLLQRGLSDDAKARLEGEYFEAAKRLREMQ